MHRIIGYQKHRRLHICIYPWRYPRNRNWI